VGSAPEGRTNDGGGSRRSGGQVQNGRQDVRRCRRRRGAHRWCSAAPSPVHRGRGIAATRSPRTGLTAPPGPCHPVPAGRHGWTAGTLPRLTGSRRARWPVPRCAVSLGDGRRRPDEAVSAPAGSSPDGAFGRRAHPAPHDALTEFGPSPDDGPWEEFSARLRFAGGGFDRTDPGNLPGVLGEARDELGADPQYVHYLAVPPSTFAPITEGLVQHGFAAGARVVYEKPYGTPPESFRELDNLVLSLPDEEPGLPHRPRPRQGGHPGPPRAALRQRALPPGLEPRARPAGGDRRAGGARRRRPTRSSRLASGSTPTGGGTCRSCCAPASGWLGAPHG
jgi:hypothetical protein